MFLVKKIFEAQQVAWRCCRDSLEKFVQGLVFCSSSSNTIRIQGMWSVAKPNDEAYQAIFPSPNKFTREMLLKFTTSQEAMEKSVDYRLQTKW